MRKILANCNNHYLFECKNSKFIVTTDFRGEKFDCNMYGTKQEIIDELTRWSVEVDQGNEFMLEIENTFINVLKNYDGQNYCELVKFKKSC